MRKADAKILLNEIRKSKYRPTEAEKIFLAGIEEALPSDEPIFDQKDSADLQAIYRRSTGFTDLQREERI